MKLTRPKGTKDILPEETPAWQWVEGAFSRICHRHGFGEIRVPTFEQTELFSRGVGDATDIVQKEMYTFDDKGGRSMTLRPEGTAGVVRAFLENGMASLPAPLKLYYKLTAFRYEKSQRGRYREFNQLGCELFGSKGPLADAEIIGLIEQFFQSLGLKETDLRLSSIGCPVCRKDYHQLLQRYFEPRLADLCALCQDRFERNPLRILDCKVESCQQTAAAAPRMLDHLCAECADHFTELKAYLTGTGIRFTVDPGIVRGLDYYTKTVFEFVSTHVGTQGTICGGGRYDGLVRELGGPDTPGIGFALGVERLLLELEAQGVALPKVRQPDLYLASFPETRAAVAALAYRLRRAGYRIEQDLQGRSLKAQIKDADRRRADWLLVLGSAELEQGKAELKRLADGFTTLIDLQDWASWPVQPDDPQAAEGADSPQAAPEQ